MYKKVVGHLSLGLMLRRYKSGSDTQMFEFFKSSAKLDFKSLSCRAFSECQKNI